MVKLLFYVCSWGGGVCVDRDPSRYSSMVSVSEPLSFEDARKLFHEKWCETWGIEDAEISASNWAFYRSPAFYRRDGKIGLDNSLLDKYGCPDSVYRGV